MRKSLLAATFVVATLIVGASTEKASAQFYYSSPGFRIGVGTPYYGGYYGYRPYYNNYYNNYYRGYYNRPYYGWGNNYYGWGNRYYGGRRWR
jgi:hypothetical protein